MGNADGSLRVKVPCADEQEFYARLADVIAENGLRVPAAERFTIGAHARVALEFRDGGTLAGDAVVEEHVDLDSGPGVKVRFLRLDPAGASATDAPARARARAAPAPSRGRPRPPEPELAVGLFADADLVAGTGDGRTAALAFTQSTEIAATVERHTARFQRAALAVTAAAVLVAGAGFAIARWSGAATPQAAAVAHVEAADRLLAEGRLTGKDGALDHLLAAKRLRPDDPATARKLERLADLLERLAAGALDRGDLAVASIHLAAARAAAPDRPSLVAKQADLERRARAKR